MPATPQVRETGLAYPSQLCDLGLITSFSQLRLHPLFKGGKNKKHSYFAKYRCFRMQDNNIPIH